MVLRSLFFFSSRRRHTRFDCDWSSDVCSSDLRVCQTVFNPQSMALAYAIPPKVPTRPPTRAKAIPSISNNRLTWFGRSEERRVGKECRSWWSAHHQKKEKLNLLAQG